MAKILIVGKRHWKTNDKKTGEEIEGESYIGFLENDKAIKFTSLEDYPVHTGEVNFNAKLAIDVVLLTSLFAGEVKYKDGKSYGEQNPL